MKDLTLGVREFQAHIGRALRAVTAGQRVVITSHDRPVAVVIRPDRAKGPASALDRKLDRLASEGFLRRSNGKPIREIPVYRLTGVLDQLKRDRR
ncbi:MAG: type II toxin-antitoxin system prevent-host-death family antitoxin [Planctomycetes bacterium]|nr:type II toxin-antitoxin system prevent-host-death family antitoxin [Planctomycetota bacterium]